MKDLDQQCLPADKEAEKPLPERVLEVWQTHPKLVLAALQQKGTIPTQVLQTEVPCQ